MKNYDFPIQFRALYDRAVVLYAKGQRDAIDSVDCPCRRRLVGPELQGERQNAGGKQ